MGFTLQHSTLQWPACRTVAFEESTSHCQFRVNVPDKHFGTKSVRIFNKNVSPTNGFMLVVPSLGHIIPFRHFPIHNNGHLILVLFKALICPTYFLNWNQFMKSWHMWLWGFVMIWVTWMGDKWWLRCLSEVMWGPGWGIRSLHSVPPHAYASGQFQKHLRHISDIYCFAMLVEEID